MSLKLRPLYPQGKSPVPNKFNTGYTPGPDWAFERKEKSVNCAGVRKTDRLVHSIVTMKITIPRLPENVGHT